MKSASVKSRRLEFEGKALYRSLEGPPLNAWLDNSRVTEAIEVGWLAAGAAVIGGLVSCAYQHWRDWWTRPKLSLKFDPLSDKVETSWDGQYPFGGIVLRASVRNQGHRPASNCRMFITDLTSVQSSGRTPTGFRDSRQIAWAGWSFESRAIPQGVTFYADFIRISKHESGWQFPFERSMAQDEPLKRYKGTYRLRLIAVADNAAPARLDIDVDYNSDWNNLRAWEPSK